MLKKSHNVMSNLLEEIRYAKKTPEEFIIGFDYNNVIIKETEIWDIIIHEIARQIYTDCNERVQLVERFRFRLSQLFIFSNHLFNTFKSLYLTLGEKYN